MENLIFCALSDTIKIFEDLVETDFTVEVLHRSAVVKAVDATVSTCSS